MDAGAGNGDRGWQAPATAAESRKGYVRQDVQAGSSAMHPPVNASSRGADADQEWTGQRPCFLDRRMRFFWPFLHDATEIARLAMIELPVGYEIVHKDIAFSDIETKKIKRKASVSKNDHFRNLITTCVKNNILFDYVLADNWFGSAENMKYIDNDMKKQFIIGIKSNRTVALSKADKISNQFQQVSSLEMESQLDLLAHSLEIKGFSSTQYLDIFRGFSQAVSNIVNDYFNNIHQDNLTKILRQMPTERLMAKYLPPEEVYDREKQEHRVTEIFLRDRIASSLGLQQLDLFLSRILNTLYQQSHELPVESLRLLLNYDPQKAVTPLYPVKKGLEDIIHLGNKGLNLTRIRHYGMPVPPGFIITTEVFRCREIVDNYPPAKKNFQDQVALEVAAVEKLARKTFGDPNNPLLFSVRSGSSISQPGMMDTFLDVGINETIVLGMIAQTGNEWFGWDTYRRFLQSYGMAFGLLRDDFDAIIDDFKQRLGVPFKKDFIGQQMKAITMAYKSIIQDSGIEIELSPFSQLHVAIQKVFDSWKTPKAETYRRIMSISDDWGTAVTVQAMVFGNFSSESGAGVFFTHNPRWSGDMLTLWGDFSPGNQGEDVVSGLVSTYPVSIKQAEIENRQKDTTLETSFPAIYQTMRDWANELFYERHWSPQEMEFTFESPDTEDLYCLQTRDMVIRERKKVYSFDMAQEKHVKFLGHGIGVSGGAMTGRIVFTLEEIKHWRKAEPETSLIIVRGDTVPDDIREIHEADGLLTARGGSTSHAAIVAHRLGKTCVVGCANMVCMEKQRTCSFNQESLKSGDWVSIDGREGSVYSGKMKIQKIESN